MVQRHTRQDFVIRRILGLQSQLAVSNKDTTVDTYCCVKEYAI